MQTENNQQETPTLSNSVLLLIFKWLKHKDLVSCSLVCQSWKRAASDNSLWTNVDLSRHRRNLNEKRILSFIASRGSTQLISLNLSHLSITPLILKSLKSKCPNLKFLNLQQCCFDRFIDEIEDYANIPDQLELLNIRHTHDHPFLQAISRKLQLVKYLAFTNSFLLNVEKFEFFRVAKNLVGLYISHSSAASDDMLSYIARKCRHLKSLSIRHCSNIYGEDLHEVLEKCKNLRSLYIVGINIDNGALQSCDLSKSRLEELEVSWCKDVKSAGLRKLLSKRSSLKYLRLCSNMFGGAINCDVVTAMYFRHPKLKVFDIRYVVGWNITRSSKIFWWWCSG